MTKREPNRVFLGLEPDPNDTRERNAFGYTKGFGKASEEYYKRQDEMIAKYPQGTLVLFMVQSGEHSMLAGRPGVVVGHRGELIEIQCCDPGTVYNGEIYLTPGANFEKLDIRQRANHERVPDDS